MSRRDISNISLDKSQKSSIESRKHEDFAAGIAPNLRGSHSTMYISNPWAIRQNAKFSDFGKRSTFYNENLCELSVVFNLETNNGYQYVKVNFDNTEWIIDSVEDMKVFLNQILLDKAPVSIVITEAIIPVLAFYIVAIEEESLSQEFLSIVIQNDIFNELMVCKSPTLSVKNILDIFEYANKYISKHIPISISGYGIQKAGATPEIELAYTLAYGLEHLKKAVERGINIDTFATHLSFFWAIGMNHFQEISKMRAGRMLWAKIVKQFNPENQESLALQIHCQTSEENLTKQSPFNNITRTTIEAMGAILGGTQSLHTNTLDETIGLSDDFSVQLAQNTQVYLQQETHITKTVDPWAGSYEIEKLTEEIADKAWNLIQEIEELGGMTKAIEKGILKPRIEEALNLKQTKIDNAQHIIVGVNKYQAEEEKKPNVSETDSKEVHKLQTKRLNNLESKRNKAEVHKSLTDLAKCAEATHDNLLDLAIKAAQKRATLNEILNTLKTSNT